MERVKIFCEALCEGLVFLAKGATGKDNYDPFYSAAVLGIPNLQNTAVLSATGGMDMSRFDAAPLIAFIAAKETDYGNETDGRIPG